MDRLFDLLNLKNPFAKDFKQPLRKANMEVWSSVIDASIKYLLELKDEDGNILAKQKRKTFVLGFVTSALSAKFLAFELLGRADDPFEFLLTYKFSQDHLELLFSCIRAMLGFSNNPDVLRFKAALKKLLLHVSVGASKHANCLMFEDEAISPIFSLKWSKNRTPLVSNVDADITEKDIASLPHIDETSPYIGAIVAYIGGFIVDKIEDNLSCSVCFEAVLLGDNDDLEYDDGFIASKDRGGLTFPSNDVVRILKTCEQVFRCNVSGNDFSNPQVMMKQNLKLKLRNKTMRDLPANIFTCLDPLL